MVSHKPRVRQVYDGMDRPPMYQGWFLNKHGRCIKTPFYNSVSYYMWHLFDIKRESKL